VCYRVTVRQAALAPLLVFGARNPALLMSSNQTLVSQNSFFLVNLVLAIVNLAFLTQTLCSRGVCFFDRSDTLGLVNLTNVTKRVANLTNEINMVTPNEYRPNQFELDIVLSVYDENPGQVLNHLESCCNATSCRVFVYSSMAEGTSRSHDLEHKTHEKHDLEDWMNTETSYQKIGTHVNNSWTGGEATGFMSHIAREYDNYAAQVAFVHAHVSSWHSGRLCDIISKGVRSTVSMNGKSSYVNLNNPYPRRCVSRNNVVGAHASTKLRDNIYGNWTRWFGSEPPVRVTWECCAQFITTRETLRNKPRMFWDRALSSMESPNWKIPWEYLWPTLVNEDDNVKKAVC